MNVIVVVTDSLRRDHLGCYGNRWIQTPCIDAFAQEGALFEEAYSEGLPTLPTRTAWWTGRFTFPFRGWQHFELSDALLAEVLWSRGYTTALITDVYHLHKPGMNCGRGWDTVQFIRGQEYDP
ncbi:MAG: sulfatase-like hydrolase/transferase, partial [Armatimonadota bacterium]|nr:sulfatase-like hydrolase/transferase [Armatimonadota bacterium]